jgi:hypothetical protein
VRLAGALGLLLLGALTAVAAVVAHELWWGLPLTAAALVAVMVGVGPGWLTRLPVAVGFVLTVGLAVPARPEGDYVVASGPRGLLLLGLALLVLVAAIATLPRPGRARPAGGVDPSTRGPTTYHGARD